MRVLRRAVQAVPGCARPEAREDLGDPWPTVAVQVELEVVDLAALAAVDVDELMVEQAQGEIDRRHP